MSIKADRRREEERKIRRRGRDRGEQRNNTEKEIKVRLGLVGENHNSTTEINIQKKSR